jgi:hypothetical protein
MQCLLRSFVMIKLYIALGEIYFMDFVHAAVKNEENCVCGHDPSSKRSDFI